MYRVLKKFRDLQDGGRLYEPGDKYPRPGLEVDDSRLEELSSNRNRRGVALIVSDLREEASPEPLLGLEESNTDSHPIEPEKAKEKPRKGRRRNAGTDS